MHRLLTTFALCLLSADTRAEVVVLANRTSTAIGFESAEANGLPLREVLAPGEVRPYFGAAPFRVSFDAPTGRRSYPLKAASAYYFGSDAAGGFDLQELGLAGAAAPALAPGEVLPPPLAEFATVPVVIYADDEQLMRPEIWSRQFTTRIAEASALLERHARVKLQVLDVRVWDSDDPERDFLKSVAEFERECPMVAGQLAIGFTSQYQEPEVRIHMGGTRGPLWSHILIREWSAHATERERLELLLHELGHYLGAIHSPEPDSVMRPVLLDRRSRRVGFEVRYDPLNTLAMALVGEELRRGRVRTFRDLSATSRRSLGRVYATLGPALPGDHSATHYQSLVAGNLGAAPLATGHPAKRVIAGLLAAAQAEQAQRAIKLGEAQPSDAEALNRLVRAAAQTALQLPANEGPRALLLALGLALGDAEVLRKYPRTTALVEQLETPAERKERKRLGLSVTFQQRADLAKHFFVSAFLTAATSKGEAEKLGVAKEVLDAQGDSGFSFADIAADRAGVRFAETVLAGHVPLPALAANFRTADFVPLVSGLPEGLPHAEFLKAYGGVGTKKFQQEIRRIDGRIDRLPPYAMLKLEP